MLIRRVLATVAVCGAVPVAAQARAGVTGVSFSYAAGYVQTGPQVPTSEQACEVRVSVQVSDPADIDTAILFLPSDEPPVPEDGFVMASFPPGAATHYYESVLAFTIEEALSIRPFGEYLIELSGGLLGTLQAPVQQPYEMGTFPSAVPAFDGATFDGLQGMDPSSLFVLGFGSHDQYPGASTFSRIAIFDISSGQTVFNQSLPCTAASVDVPADTLAPNRPYRIYLDFFVMHFPPAVFDAPAHLTFTRTTYFDFTTGAMGAVCDGIDFNSDGLFPDTADIDDFLSVFSGGPCSTGTCGDIDFNNDGLFPDTADIDAMLSVFSGGPCV